MSAGHARSIAALLATAAVAAGCGATHATETWPLPAGDLAGTRAVRGSAIDASNVHRLRVRWRFRLTSPSTFSGIFASTPVVDRDTVYIQDLRSNVFALDRATGRLRWRHIYRASTDGPNGLAVARGRVYGATDTSAFALSAATGRELWRTPLVRRSEQFVDVAPVVWHDLVVTSTVGYVPYGRGAIYALSAATGRVRWRFVTVAHPWPHPFQAGGGGLWYPVSVDSEGRLYAGNSNPTPWGGTRADPNGAVFPGPVPYTDSLLVLDARTGRLLWSDQVTPHDVRDYDFEATPIVAGDAVFGAGKAGRVVAWNRRTHARIWSTAVGLHRNDLGPLPRRRVPVCPGLLGGVETPMAYAQARLFVPVVDLCGWGSAVSRQSVTSLDPSTGRGRLVALDAATGRTLWARRLPSPDFGCAAVAGDVVFTATYDGSVYGFATADGRRLWHWTAPVGINGCPALAGDLLLVGAGVTGRRGDVGELVALGIP